MKESVHEQLIHLASKLKHINFNNLDNNKRAEKFSLEFDRIYLNFSRNIINQTVLELLINLAKEKGLKQKIDAMFFGEKINTSENRAVKHWLLRAPLNSSDMDSVFVHKELDKMQALSERIKNNTLLDKEVKDIICIGIGGSELGARLVYEALTMGRKNTINAHFVANIDGMAAIDAIVNCNPKTTLILVTSKTFTTFETSKNFSTIKNWFCQQGGLSETDFYKQCCAITANADAALSVGIPGSQIFKFWDWVGGRYSVWSVVGLPIVITCGMKLFKDFLAGAHAIDKHFKESSFNKNLPVILGLIHIWYSRYLHYTTRCVVPYAQNLRALPEFLQQLEMESLGKSVDINGEAVIEQTCPIVWGAVGSNAQHAFFQLLHQGTQIAPLDIIAAISPCDNVGKEFEEQMQEHHIALLANCLGQSKSLIQGGDMGHNGHGKFMGNRSSNLILLDKIDAYSLGQLIALYEHKVLVQSTIWGINAYDQFGVELGKNVCNEILSKNNKKIDFSDIKESFK